MEPLDTSAGEPRRAWQPLESLHGEVRRFLGRLGRLRPVAAGEVVFREGEPGDALFVVEDGEIVLSFGDAKNRKTLGPGALFGEIAILAGGTPRTATAVSSGRGSLRVIDRAAMDRLQRESPEILCALLQETCACLVQSERELVADLRWRNRELEQTLDYLRRTNDELGATERLARTDELTGLYNRRCFNVQTPRLIDAAANEDLGLGLVLADLDHLKGVNDAHGHAAGDALLEALGAALRETVRDSDLPCRLGGDEFAVLLTGVDERGVRERARALAEAVRAIVVDAGGALLRPTVSIGAAVYEPGDDTERLLRRADESLYAAKAAGRDRVVVGGRSEAAPTSD